MPSLPDIPLEVLIDNLLPVVPLKDILSLASTNKDYAALCSDDTFWKRKLLEDYNFSDASSARTKGYKYLYKGFHKAKVYVWGSTGEGRLGLGRVRAGGGILTGSRPYPTQLKVPGPRIVELVAGGWSFHALDALGCMHVWGQLDGSAFGLNGDPFSRSTKRTSRPMKLDLPEKISKISCGRAHATALSSINRIWVFTSWGRPYVLTTPILSRSSDSSTPRQVECGWSFSAVLTHGGEVYVWWPFDGEFGRLTDAHHDATDGENGDVVEERDDDIIQCRPWELNAQPSQIKDVAVTLPSLQGEMTDVRDRIVKIAAGDQFLIGLTEGGHVLKANVGNDPTAFTSIQGRPKWEYLPQFSEVEHVRAHFTSAPESATAPVAPDALQITHISAHFHTFFAYSTGSSSIVLRGSEETDSLAHPDIPPSLQHQDIISVVLGDYHFGALTSTGKLLTWGAYSSGALGLGDPTQLPVGAPGGYEQNDQRERAKRFRIVPPDVREPTEVKFGTQDGANGRQSFVFSASASGWHTGALVIDLEDTDEEDSEKGGEGVSDDSEAHDNTYMPGQPWAGPAGLMLPFRIGLAGARGRGRGRGRGGGSD